MKEKNLPIYSNHYEHLHEKVSFETEMIFAQKIPQRVCWKAIFNVRKIILNSFVKANMQHRRKKLQRLLRYIILLIKFRAAYLFDNQRAIWCNYTSDKNGMLSTRSGARQKRELFVGLYQIVAI